MLEDMELRQAESRLNSRKLDRTISNLLGYYGVIGTHDFACGTLETSLAQKTITFNFDGSGPCNASGIVVIGVELDEGAFSYTLIFNNLVTEACAINGQTTGSFVFGDGAATFTHTSSSLQFCSSTFDGTSSIVINTSDGSLESATIDSDISLEMDGETVTVQAKLTYDSNGVNGTADIKKGRKTYECVFENVAIDADCGIPNGGTITVNGVEVDFSGASCAYPYVTVTVKGRSVQMSLEDAVAMLS